LVALSVEYVQGQREEVTAEPAWHACKPEVLQRCIIASVFETFALNACGLAPVRHSSSSRHAQKLMKP
jgi:hypothetical protein